MSSEAIEKLLQLAPALADGMKKGPGHVMVRCPWHKQGRERTPSLSISTWKPVFWCHGCGMSGHLSQLMREFGIGQSVIEIALPRSSYEHKSKEDQLTSKIVRNADPFRGPFILDERLLDTYRSAPTYLLNTGFEKETLRHFEVGYDQSNLRITFPLRSVFGDLVGISGRAIYDTDQRYKIYDRELKARQDFPVPANYSMEEVKSAVLWHAHVVRPLFFLRNSGKQELVITEGFKACMWTWQSGYKDVVALVGSYLTPAHAELIARATRKVTLFLDNNEAGWKGTTRAGRLLLKKGCEVCVAKYPDTREHPDDLSPTELLDTIICQEPFRAWSAEHPQPEPTKMLLRRAQSNRAIF